MKIETNITKLEQQAEELECVNLWLTDQKVPTKDKTGTFSIVGRIKWLLKQAYINANKDIEEAIKTKTV